MNGGPEPVTNNSAKAAPSGRPPGLKLDQAPRAAAARRKPVTKHGPAALASAGNHRAGPRLGHSPGGPSSHRDPPGRGKEVRPGETRKQARRSDHPAPATSQPVWHHGQPGTQTTWTRLEPDLTPFPNSRDLATRLGAQPFTKAACRFTFRRKVANARTIERFFAPTRPPRKKSPENIYSEATREHFTQVSNDGSQQLDSSGTSP